MEGVDAPFWTIVGVSYAFMGLLIYFSWRGRNWARLLFAITTIAGLALMLFPWGDDYFTGWTTVDVLVVVALSFMDLTGIYWLYTGESKDWFRRPAR